MENSLKLNLGCGDNVIIGYENIDIKPVSKDVRLGDFKNLNQLNIKDGTVDTILAHNIIRYLRMQELPNILTHWISKMAPQGLLTISDIDVDVLAGNLMASNISLSDFNVLIYGTPGSIPCLGLYNLDFIERILCERGMKIETRSYDGHNFFLTMRRA